MRYLYTGSVVKFADSDELYVVSKSDTKDNKVDKVVLLSFKHSNTSTHLSRAHPFKNEDHHIDNLIFVSDTISNYYNEKVRKVLREHL